MQNAQEYHVSMATKRNLIPCNFLTKRNCPVVQGINMQKLYEPLQKSKGFIWF